MDFRIFIPPLLWNLLALAALTSWSAASPFTSLHVFGDGVCTTNGNTDTSVPFYDNVANPGAASFCNGRVWIEVLSEWQGLTYVEANNNSFFGHDSEQLVSNTANLTAPTDVATALFVVWASNADLVGFLNSGATTPPYDAADEALWNDFIVQSVADHETSITTLYNKGVRTIVLPAAVDIGLVPLYEFFNATAKSFIRQRVIDLNTALAAEVSDLTTTFPDLTIHQPDTFAFLDDVVANPSNYDLTVSSIDALSDFDMGNIPNNNLDGPGADYVFWDYVHPTAKVQMHLAALVQQEICPIQITGLNLSGGNTLLDLVNIPLNRSGVVEGRTGPGPWAQDTTILESFASGSTNKTISFPTPTTTRLQRVRFPVTWSWP